MDDKSDMNKHFGYSAKIADFKLVEVSWRIYREIYSLSGETLNEEPYPV